MGKAIMIPNVNWASKNFGRVTRADQLSIEGASTITASGTYTAYYNGNEVSVTWRLTGNGTLSQSTGTTTTVIPSVNGTLLLSATYGDKTASLSITAEPYNYDVLDHITGSGQQNIVTDYYPNAKTVIEARYKFNSTTTKQQRIFSDRVAGQSVYTYLCDYYLNGSGIAAAAFGSSSGTTFISHNTTYSYIIRLDSPNKSGVLTRSDGNVTNKTLTGLTATSVTPLTIFSDSTGVNPMAEIDLYYLKIWEDDVLLHDYEPRALNGVCGLLDTVTGIFYDSDTETPFTGE